MNLRKAAQKALDELRAYEADRKQKRYRAHTRVVNAMAWLNDALAAVPVPPYGEKPAPSRKAGA